MWNVDSAIKSADVVVFDHMIKALSEADDILTSMTSVIHHISASGSHARAVYDAFLASQATKIYWGAGWDLHWTAADLAKICATCQALMHMYPRRPKVGRESIAPTHVDDWMSRHDDPVKNWDYLDATGLPTIELAHCIEDSSIVTATTCRPNLIALPGINYATRKIARRQFISQDLRPVGMILADGLLRRMLGWMPLDWRTRSSVWLRVRYWLQRYLLEHSTFTYVCGSGYRYAVRKFFEVCAAVACSLPIHVTALPISASCLVRTVLNAPRRRRPRLSKRGATAPSRSLASPRTVPGLFANSTPRPCGPGRSRSASKTLL